MNREPKTPPLETWQIFNAAIHHLTKEYLTRHYGVSNRQIERWSANPETTESTARNPMDRYEVILKRLMEFGHEDIARTAVRRQVRIVGCEMAVQIRREHDVCAIEEECLQDYPSVVKFHEAIREGRSVSWVRHYLDTVKQELDETMESYERKCNGNPAKIQEGPGD